MKVFCRRALGALALLVLGSAGACSSAPVGHHDGGAGPDPAVPGGAVRFLANGPAEYDFGDQRHLPPTFGRAEFTLEFWIRPDTAFLVGNTAHGTPGQLVNWSDADPEPYSTLTWWLTDIPGRVDMRYFWDALSQPDNPRHLGGWSWGSEVMLSWNYFFTQYEDYKGLLAELRFWDRAKSQSELSAAWNHAVTGSEPGLVGWSPLNEGSGGVAMDGLEPTRTTELQRSREESWSGDAPPLVARP